MKDMSYYSSFLYRFTKPLKRLYFKFLLSRNKLIKVDDRHRGIGKTYMMIGRASKRNIPIIVGNQQQVDLIKRHGNVCEVYGYAPNYRIAVMGKDFPNGIMIDESVDPDMIPELQALYKIRGGFIQDYKSGKQDYGEGKR